MTFLEISRTKIFGGFAKKKNWEAAEVVLINFFYYTFFLQLYNYTYK
jgi:hypothetical protein